MSFPCQAFFDCQAFLPAEQDTYIAGGSEKHADDCEFLQFKTTRPAGLDEIVVPIQLHTPRLAPVALGSVELKN